MCWGRYCFLCYQVTKRYAHINGLRGDGVNPGLLGMNKVVSEDSVRRSLQQMDEVEGVHWLQDSNYDVYAPLLSEPWILDADATIKTLYGHQEGAGSRLQPAQTRVAPRIATTRI